MIITNAWIRTLVHDNNLEVYVIMKFFIDTANVDYIKEPMIWELFVVLPQIRP